jgi:hypothetical protein
MLKLFLKRNRPPLQGRDYGRQFEDVWRRFPPPALPGSGREGLFSGRAATPNGFLLCLYDEQQCICGN